MTISLSDIETALRAEDVEGLIASGAPGDEYVSEAKQIAKAVASLSPDRVNEATIIAILSFVWARSFNRSDEEIKQRIPAFQKIAQRLLQAA